MGDGRIPVIGTDYPISPWTLAMEMVNHRCSLPPVFFRGRSLIAVDSWIGDMWSSRNLTVYLA
jgi:hypothetical protein